jgi:hypothetical protein
MKRAFCAISQPSVTLSADVKFSFHFAATIKQATSYVPLHVTHVAMAEMPRNSRPTS